MNSQSTPVEAGNGENAWPDVHLTRVAAAMNMASAAPSDLPGMRYYSEEKVNSLIEAAKGVIPATDLSGEAPGFIEVPGARLRDLAAALADFQKGDNDAR